MKLSDMTCLQLAEWLEESPAAKEPERLQKLRRKFNFGDIKSLKMLGKTSARYWHAALRSCSLIKQAPTLDFRVGGGIPKSRSKVHFSRRAKEIAAQNGICFEKFNGGAVILERPKDGR